MSPTAALIDLSLYRTRKQAQQRARAMWSLYLRNAGLPDPQASTPSTRGIRHG
ncbi:hypothetical protein [Pseudomonas sp. RIT-PI-S]|uniref:hypothetical protein n=1 Tax=Pseudomonas sp. RIT-PI-S TaxID=3035295 RepID=UPI0021D8DC0E|nr:hypothetical protein [Pseudomonas sp. RIT-PI-S]